MTWFVDEYLDKQLRALDLCPGVDVNIDTPDLDVFIDISVFWSAPKHNLDWYPICQIDVNNKTIFHGEGGENPDSWGSLMNDAADALEENLRSGSKS